MKGKALRKHSLHEKTAASVLLKLFTSSNEWFHTTDALLAHEQNSIFKCKQHTCTLHDPWRPEKYDYTMSFTAATQAIKPPHWHIDKWLLLEIFLLIFTMTRFFVYYLNTSIVIIKTILNIKLQNIGIIII